MPESSFFFFSPSNLLSSPFYSSSLPIIVVAQIRGHKAGSSLTSPLRCVPCIFIARGDQLFLPSSNCTRQGVSVTNSGIKTFFSCLVLVLSSRKTCSGWKCKYFFRGFVLLIPKRSLCLSAVAASCERDRSIML